MNSTRSQRPSTAPTNNAGFTGSQTGGYQGARADPYDSSQRSVRSVTRGGELAEIFFYLLWYLIYHQIHGYIRFATN